MKQYSQKINSLLTLGEEFETSSGKTVSLYPAYGKWVDYPREFGLDAGHIPELIEVL